MNAELKLNINKDLLEKAEAYSKEEGRSLSDIVARYLKALCEWQHPLQEDVDPEIEALIGMGGQLEDEENVDYKELLADAMSEKHLK